MENTEIYIPDEIMGKLQNFHIAMEKMEETLQPLLKTNINSSDIKLSPLDRARLNLASGYALNSLFWMFLNTLGVNPKDHGIRVELERYKSFMQRIKEITDKDKAPVLNKDAAQRFVRNALWEPNEQKETSDCSSNQALNVKEDKRNCSFTDHGKKKKRRH
ncbi:nuclear nucleic acid-binding protein C1D [Parasteatoda tepidariorum]|uniref:Nuclear nucleic acid-binding protein C1D n=1 Tax=Parasteatoda tepidariorum TaxID=114398 RepID=A0A2L2Y942_PARTP|nr:nuclear nucleic acid-binding protein C1D [Parasteatoda tepidariorum]